MKNKKPTSLEKKKSNSQLDMRSHSGSKTKSSRRALSQTQKIEEAFEEQLLDIDLTKPRTSFNFFCQEMFNSDKNNKIDSKTMKEFSKKFKSIPEKDRNKYNDLAEKDKERYEEHLSLVHTHLIKKPDYERKSGYHYYIDDQIGKALEKGEDATEARLNAREKWSKMDDESREKYNEMSHKNRETYDKLRQLRSEKISAYFLFSRDKRKSAKEKGENLTISELAKMWKNSKDYVKEKYEEYAKELKEEMDKNKDLMELALNMKPSRPPTAYNFFTKEMYQQGQVKGFGKSKQISEKWEALPDEEREKYLRMAKKERLIYIIKKQNYDSMLRKDLGKAPSAMNLFFQDMAGDKMNLQELYAKWKGSDAGTKKKYQKKAIEEKENFQKRVIEFNHRVYEKPKNILSAYTFFVKHKYKDIKAQNPDVENTQMFKLMSEAYHKLTEKQLKVYKDMADADYLVKKEQQKQYEANGYYIIDEPKKRRSTTKKDSVEEGDEPSTTKNKRKATSKSKKTKKN
jgi:hypothetical protein